VKWVVAGRVICCSKLAIGDPNPPFDEQFVLPVESVGQKVELAVFERSIERDQPMYEQCLGVTHIDLGGLEDNRYFSN
jgi:Ca2+-dependent lipid-binding protein